MHPPKEDCVLRGVLGGISLIAHHPRGDPAAAGERHDAILGKGADRQNGVFAVDRGAAEVIKQALERIAMRSRRVRTMCFDQVVRELWPNLGDDGLREAAYRGG